MSQLPLHNIHHKAGAHFADYGAWELPEHYGDPALEYHAVRKGVGLADLSFQGKFLMTGKDRIPFLQGLISNDLSGVSGVSNDTGIYTTLLTAKGKMVADFFLYPLPEALLMEIESDNAEKTRNHLMRYRLRSRVEMSVPAWGRLLVAGPGSKALIEKLVGVPLPPMAENSFFEKTLHGCSLLCIKRSVTGEADFHLYYPHEKIEMLWLTLLDDGAASNIQAIGQATLEILRVEAGQPRYGIDIDEDILPIEAGLQDKAISYTKGCYPGQEVIARIKTYGHVNKKLSGLVLEGDFLPNKGDAILLGDKKVGWVTSAVRSPFLRKVISMCYLRREVTASGTSVIVEHDQSHAKAEVVSLPFYQRE